MIIRKPASEYVFYWASLEQPEPSALAGNIRESHLEFSSSGQARPFLNMVLDFASFHRLLNRASGNALRVRRQDDYIRELADLLVRRRIRVLKRWTVIQSGATASTQLTPSPRPAPRQERASVLEAASLPPGMDMDEQSVSLTIAAHEGLPFCEECEKAARAMHSGTD
jgi:hypothetical protein